MTEKIQDGAETSEKRDRRVLRVKTADVKTAKSPWVLETLAIGSCVAVSIYDPERKIGGLCHSLLPEPTSDDEPPSAKYVSEGIELLVQGLQKEGADAQGLLAKVIGGASLFQAFSEGSELSMGTRNVEAARSILSRMGIKISGEDVGGAQGRSMSFRTDTGEVSIRSAIGEEKVL